jgi:hypothetical protein
MGRWAACSVSQQRGFRIPAVAIGILWADGLRHRVDFVNLVVTAIHIKIEAHGKEMLVVEGIHLRGHQSAVFALTRQRRRQQNPGQLHLVLDGAVLIEVPVKAVFIIVDSGEKGEDETARSPHIHLVSSPVRMLPEHAEVLFMEADRIFRHRHLTATVGEHRVKVTDFPQAVTTVGEGIGQHPHPVLP